MIERWNGYATGSVAYDKKSLNANKYNILIEVRRVNLFGKSRLNKGFIQELLYF